MVNADTVMEVQRAMRLMNIIIETLNNRRTQLADYELQFIKNGITDTITSLKQIEDNLR